MGPPYLFDSHSAKGYDQSANSALPLPQKCENCTLEELAVLRIIQQDSSAKQAFIAKETHIHPNC